MNNILCLDSRAGQCYAWIWTDADICYEVIFRHGQLITQIWLGYDIIA
uniref:Uncharacterized protein n=1 Tax=Pseudomonas phage vB_PaeS_HTN2 TaxID=3236647 RepID=A0AB39AIA8_9VIRU